MLTASDVMAMPSTWVGRASMGSAGRALTLLEVAVKEIKLRVQ